MTPNSKNACSGDEQDAQGRHKVIVNQTVKDKIMTTRKLASFEVSSVGIGCMGFSHGYGALPPEEESIRLMR